MNELLPWLVALVSTITNIWQFSATRRLQKSEASKAVTEATILLLEPLTEEINELREEIIELKLNHKREIAELRKEITEWKSKYEALLDQETRSSL